MKAAVAVGLRRRFLVGDPEIQLVDVLAGRTDRRAGRLPSSCAAEAKWSSMDRRSSRLAIASRSASAASSREAGAKFGVVSDQRCQRRCASATDAKPLPEDVVETWVLPAVLRATALRPR